MCFFHVNLESKIRTRNLRVGVKGMILLDIRRSGSAKERVRWKCMAEVFLRGKVDLETVSCCPLKYFVNNVLKSTLESWNIGSGTVNHKTVDV